MIAGLALIAAAAQAAPIDWDALPALPYRAPPILTADIEAFVEREVRVRKCKADGGSLRVDVAVLVDESNGIRTTVPRAIQCPTVEQYAAALVAGFARNNLLPRQNASEQWYRTSLTFTIK